jgi:hypothetical protein
MSQKHQEKPKSSDDVVVTLGKQIATLSHHVRTLRRTTKRQSDIIARLREPQSAGVHALGLASAAPAQPLAAQPSLEQVITAVIACLRRNQIAENASASDVVTANFEEAETADAATGNPHFRIQSFLHCLEDRLGWDPIISPSQLLNGSFDTPRRIAEAALFHHP